MALPVLTTVEDIDAVLNYLKTKALGVTIQEAGAVVDTKHLDWRKLSAMELWGLISRENDVIKITDLGRQYTRAEDGKRQALLEILRTINAYRTALEWAHFQKFETISTVEVAARWSEHNRDEIATQSEKTLNENVVCFFHLAQGAGLGQMVVGRRGSPTRLELVRENLGQFVEGGAVSEAVAQSSFERQFRQEEREQPPATLGPMKVFVAHGKNKATLDEVKEIITLGGFEPVVATEQETTAIPVPAKVLNAMRECQGAIIIVTADEAVKAGDGEETYRVNENVLIEIGGALHLYGDRVVFLWEKRIPVPTNLQGLYFCQFEGKKLELETGMRLLKALAGFRGKTKST